MVTWTSIGLILRLESLSYYTELFTYVYSDAAITEARMQDALAQFIRSIQSFDSKYDVRRTQINNNNASFPNFTAEENAGKLLFGTSPNNGGAGCNTCHCASEFDIAPNSNNNNIVGVIGNATATDLTNKRSPTLRDMVNPRGNGPLMHDGSITNLVGVIDYYDNITLAHGNNQLDNRLRGGGGGGSTGQNLNLTVIETLTGSECTQ